MTADISRHSLRPAQQFTGVVHQQGRVSIDADATESDDIAALLLRQAVTETICSRGSPDDGFTISGAVLAAGALDFSIAAGTFYLGGARLASDGVLWSRQPDWLQIAAADRSFALPAAGSRTDLVWLSAREMTVTATEDGELLETGLGGPDTTARRRMAWRVDVRRDVPPTCPEAFADLLAAQFAGGTIDIDGGEIISDARLTIGFTQLEPLEDLCRPNAQAGFLGARNEAFRIQVTTPGRFVWGRDNAAPLYRVQVRNDENGQRRRIHFLNAPRDEFGWPLAGMTVELLRWGSLLANGEKAAEPAGLLLRVTRGFDPGDEDSIRVGASIDAALDAWFATPAGQAAIQPLDAADANSFFFLRVWTGGGAGAAVDNPMPIGAAAPLGDTGLTVEFSDNGMAGDYWVVAARPNTPTQVTPWALLTGAAPAGPRRLVAPLALLTSSPSGLGTIVDCRHHFRPLCEVGACCRVTVGDGRTSFGDVLSIQAAIDRLPPEGGEVCIHPGDYAEHVTIDGGQNITITGCGRTTRWTNDAGDPRPLLTIIGASGIVVRRVAMTNLLGEAILADAAAAFAAKAFAAKTSRAITAEDLAIDCADRPAIFINGGGAHVVRRCRVALQPLSKSLADDPAIGRAAAIFLSGRELLVEHSRITLGDEAARSRTPAGGIHIGSRSRAVIIRDNLIEGGNGHGITLGTAQFVPEAPGDIITIAKGAHYNAAIRKNYSHFPGYGQGGFEYFGTGFGLSVDDCITGDGKPPPGKDTPGDKPTFGESAGAIRDIRILRNDITGMAFNGISAQIFTGLGRDGASDAIVVEQVEIAENRITGCMRGEIGTQSALSRLFSGWGGIALSICADAVIRDNRITDNGAESAEPVCGIFIAIAENIAVERNIITGNGGAITGEDVAKKGARGGVILGIVQGGTPTLTGATPAVGGANLARKGATRPSDRPALILAGNSVDAPTGRALRAILTGPALVHGNRLTGAGRSALFENPLQALVGALFGVLRSGGKLFDGRETIDLFDYVGLELLADALGGDAVSLFSLCVAEDVASVTAGKAPDAPDRLRGGEIQVNDNQISMRAHSPAMRATLSAVLLLGADDVSFADNQVEVENDVLFITSVLAVALSLRVASNRVQAAVFNGLLSIISYGFLNTTAGNQTTHCILAAGLPNGLVDTPNTTLIGLVNKDICSPFSRGGDKMSNTIGANAGLAIVK